MSLDWNIEVMISVSLQMPQSIMILPNPSRHNYFITGKKLKKQNQKQKTGKLLKKVIIKMPEYITHFSDCVRKNRNLFCLEIVPFDSQWHNFQQWFGSSLSGHIAVLDRFLMGWLLFPSYITMLTGISMHTAKCIIIF